MAKHHIRICLGSSCFARGNNSNVELVKNYLKEHGLEADISFSGRLCADMCSRSPVISIDDRVYENVDRGRLMEILKEEFPG